MHPEFEHVFLSQSYIQYSFWTKLNVLDGNINKSPAWVIVWDTRTNQGSHKLLRFNFICWYSSYDNYYMPTLCSGLVEWSPRLAPINIFLNLKFVSVVQAKQDRKKVHGIKCCLPLFLQAYATEACRKEYSHLGLSIVRYSNFPIYFFRTRKRAAYLCIKRERVVLFVCL